VGGRDAELLLQAFSATLRAGGLITVAAHKCLEVVLAFLTGVFVDWHGSVIPQC
jgi:hypothetical protein